MAVEAPEGPAEFSRSLSLPAPSSGTAPTRAARGTPPGPAAGSPRSPPTPGGPAPPAAAGQGTLGQRQRAGTERRSMAGIGRDKPEGTRTERGEDSEREQRGQPAGDGDSPEGETGTAGWSGTESERDQRGQPAGDGDSGTERRAQPGAGSAAAPPHRGRLKDTIRQVAPLARLSWMATDWSISGPAARRTALPGAGSGASSCRRWLQGDAARLRLRYRRAPEITGPPQEPAGGAVWLGTRTAAERILLGGMRRTGEARHGPARTPRPRLAPPGRKGRLRGGTSRAGTHGKGSFPRKITRCSYFQ